MIYHILQIDFGFQAGPHNSSVDCFLSPHIGRDAVILWLCYLVFESNNCRWMFSISSIWWRLLLVISVLEYWPLALFSSIYFSSRRRSTMEYSIIQFPWNLCLPKRWTNCSKLYYHALVKMIWGILIIWCMITIYFSLSHPCFYAC